MSEQPTPAETSSHDLAALFERRLSDQGHAPFLTFYDDLSGERTELSYATFDNWVAKTANFLVEEFDAGPGREVVTATGTHWTTVVIAFACWRSGSVVAPVSASAAAPELRKAVAARSACALFLREDVADQLRTAGEHLDNTRTVAVGTGLGARLTADAGDALGFAEEVPAFADQFEDPGGDPAGGALAIGEAEQRTSLSLGALLAVGQAAVGWGLSAQDRLLCARPLRHPEGLILGCLAPFAAGASTVVVRRPDAGLIERKIRDERVTLALVDAPMADRMPHAGTGPPGFRGALPGSIDDWLARI